MIMTSIWLGIFYLFSFILVFVRACAQTRELQNTKCTCIDQDGYFELKCPLSNGDYFKITTILSKFKCEINCYGYDINNVSYIPTLYQDRLSKVEYFGYNNCSMKNLKQITDKLLQKSRNIKYLELKSIDQLTGDVLDGYNIEGIGLSQSLMENLPENLLEYVPNLKNIIINDYKMLQTIPEKFFQYTKNLTLIDLGNNNLINIPNGLFTNLKQLERLYLHANKIKNIDNVLLSDLHNLDTLEMMSNHLVTIPNDIFKNLQNLQLLSIRNNGLTSIPEHIFKYNRNLQSIQLSNNPNLTILPDYLFANLSLLSDVTLDNCNLSTIPENIFWGANNLENLTVKNNKLKHLRGQLFKDSGKLENLYLENNILEILDDNIFNSTMNLKQLNLANNQLHINDKTFSGLENLIILDLSYNMLTKLTLNNLKHFKKLINLNLSHNNLNLEREHFISTSIIPFLNDLEILNLEYNSVTTIFSDWNYSLLKLKNLNLANNLITFLSYNHLQFLQDHDVNLNLENNQITTIDLSTVETLIRQNSHIKNKRIVKLKGNPIHCDCQIYDFIRYVDKYMNDSVYKTLILQIDYDYTKLKCASPEIYKGQSLSDINSKLLTCTLDNGPKLPPLCHMQHYQYRNFDNRLIVNCSNTGLETLPEILFDHINISYRVQEIEVLLSGNKIVSMPEPHKGYENVVELDLSHNFINEISWVPPNIKILRLNDNNLTYMSDDELTLLRKNSIENITLHNNPWQCNCDLINFTKYLQENYQKVPQLHKITCSNDNEYRELTRLTPEDLCPYKTYLIVIICVTLAIIAIFISMLVALYYRFNIPIKVWLYAHNMCLYFITEDEIDQDKLYDAFISYSHEDEEFVVKELMPGLEDEPHRFKLCLHFRNWQPGEFITRNIARSIDESRRTIVVVSKGFLKSEWGKMEFRTAHTEAMKEGRARVIMIIYGDIGKPEELDSEIKAYLDTNTYIKWGTPWFWNNLRYAMPHASKYARIPEIVTRESLTKISLTSNNNGKDYNEKSDLIHEPSTPPAATTPPADSTTTLRNSSLLLTPTALNVSLINRLDNTSNIIQV